MPDRLKIIHTNLIKNWGGGESQLLNLYEGLGRLNVEQIIVCAHGSELHQVCQQKNINHHTINKRGNFSLKAANELKNLCSHFQPTLLHVHDTISHSFAVMANTFLNMKMPIVISRRLAVPLRQKKLTKFKYANRYIKKVICVSRAVQQAVSSLVPLTRSEVIYEGFDVAAFARSTLTRRSSNQVIACIGRLAKEKDQRLFIDAAAILINAGVNAQFQLIGDGPEKEHLLQYVKQNNLQQYVEFLGFKDNVAELLNTIDVVAVTSKTEAFPIVTLEAMAAKVPVVAMSIDGLKEMIQHQKTGLLVDLRDPKMLAEQMRLLLDDQLLYQNIVDNAFQFVSQFTVEKMSQQTLALYRQIVS